MKYGVLLCGGKGTRMAPFSNLFNKSLVPLGGKFLIDYPINTLKSLGITDLVVVLGGEFYGQIVSYLKGGEDFGLNITYRFQSSAAGIAQGLNLAKDIVGDNDFIAILGDNIFLPSVNFGEELLGCNIVLKAHAEIERFGVASIADGKIAKIQEKPKLSILPKSQMHYAISGLYKFDAQFFDFFKSLKPSARGEFEVVDIIGKYHETGSLNYTITDAFWQDCGTFDTLRKAENYIERMRKQSDI